MSHERRFYAMGGRCGRDVRDDRRVWGQPSGEAAALRWLAEAESVGGIRVARVLSVTEDEHVEERVATGTPSVAAARRIGAALARTHAAGAPWYGCARTAGPGILGAAGPERPMSRVKMPQRAGAPSLRSTAL